MAKPKESRFKWRHDCILAVAVNELRCRVEEVNAMKPDSKKSVLKGISFVRAGESTQPEKKSKQGKKWRCVLDEARDWEVLCDLRWEREPGSWFMFPCDIALTGFKPDALVICIQVKENLFRLGIDGAT